jgi:molybdate transport system substrate-binding protein
MKIIHLLSLHSQFTRMVVASAAAAACSTPALAQLNVMISGGFAVAYRQVLPEFEKANGIKVNTGSGASQGSGPLTIAAQLKRGVPADVVILSREGLTELMAAGRIVAGTDVDLARVPLGAGVRTGVPKPDIKSVAAFKQALLNAKTIAVPGSTSGIYLTTEVFPKMGVADQLSVSVKERGSQAAAMVAAGEANMAVQPVSELVNEGGIDFVGRLPAELQLVQVFAAAVVTGAKEPEAAKKLIQFLASERTGVAIEKSGMDRVR